MFTKRTTRNLIFAIVILFSLFGFSEKASALTLIDPADLNYLKQDPIPNIIYMNDFGDDYDGEIGLMMLAYLQTKGFVNIKAVISDSSYQGYIMDSILSSYGISNVPIGVYNISEAEVGVAGSRDGYLGSTEIIGCAKFSGNYRDSTVVLSEVLTNATAPITLLTNGPVESLNAFMQSSSGISLIQNHVSLFIAGAGYFLKLPPGPSNFAMGVSAAHNVISIWNSQLSSVPIIFAGEDATDAQVSTAHTNSGMDDFSDSRLYIGDNIWSTKNPAHWFWGEYGGVHYGDSDYFGLGYTESHDLLRTFYAVFGDNQLYLQPSDPGLAAVNSYYGNITWTPTTGVNSNYLISSSNQSAIDEMNLLVGNIAYTAASEAEDYVSGLSFYTIATSTDGNGSISPSGDVSVVSGGSQPVAIIPNGGYYVLDVLVDDESVGAVTSYTFSNVTADHTISATFETETYIINASAGDNGSISPSGDVEVIYYEDPVFTITPDTGYYVSDVLVDDESIGYIPTSYTFEDVTANHTISATFTIHTYTLDYAAGSNGIVPVYNSHQTVNYGATGGSIKALANTGYHFVSWSDGSTVNPRRDTNVHANISVTATFAINTYTITASPGSNGSISPSGGTSVTYGGDQSIDITPDDGYYISDVLVDSVSVGAVSSYTFEDVTADHTISATFERTLVPVSGVCGSSNGQNLSSIPVSNFCSAGTASLVSGSGPWTWTCAGIDGGSNASCSASIVLGSCGGSNYIPTENITYVPPTETENTDTTTTTTPTISKTEMIEKIMSQIAELQAKIKSMQQGDNILDSSYFANACSGITFARTLKLYSSGQDVKCLQAILNSDSDTEIAISGAGSRGKETTTFGLLTKQALVKFQEKYASEILTPQKMTKGNGIVGPATREKLNNLLK